MSPPLLGVKEEDEQRNISLLTSSASLEIKCKNGSNLKERNYMGLSNCSSVDSSTISSEDNNGGNLGLNLMATELRLGLPGSQSPKRDSELCLLNSGKLDEKTLFPLHPSKDGNINNYSLLPKGIVSGNKRGFSDAMNEFSEGKFTPNSNTCLKATIPQSTLQEKPCNDEVPKLASATTNNSNAPATKAQVVGWPPVRSYWKNTSSSTSKNTEEVEGKSGSGGLFVKVSMDGAPYLRKVDLKTYSAYQELSSALEKMFSCFTLGQYGSHGASGKEMLSESKLKDLLNGSEYVLTYEDKDNDWMLVGDVPWEMFINTCKRLRIMKSCDAIGLAPRAMEKSRNRN